MKWFKHDAHAMRKAGLERVIMEFGMDGYGLYWACLEMIAGDLTIENLNFELNHDAELIAYKFKMDTIRVEKIMLRCIELGLFDLAESGKLMCLGLAKMVDDTMSRNPEIRKIKDGAEIILRKNGRPVNSDKTTENPEETSENPEENPDNLPIKSDQRRLDKTRLDKNKEKEKKKETLSIILNHWLSKKGLQQHKKVTAKKHILKKHYEIIEEYGIEDVLRRMDNYHESFTNDSLYDWDLTLWRFIELCHNHNSVIQPKSRKTEKVQEPQIIPPEKL